MNRFLIGATIIFGNLCIHRPFINDFTEPEAFNYKIAITHDSIFTLKGKISGQTRGYIKIIYADKNGKAINDSAEIINGHFQFSGSINEPTVAFLRGSVKSRPDSDPNATSFFIEPAVINIELTFNQFKKAIITGSKTEDDNKTLSNSIARVRKEMEPLSKEFDKASTIYREAVKAKKDEAILQGLKNKIEIVRDKYEPYNKRITKLEYEFFSRHPQSYITAFNLRFYVSYLSLDSLKLFYNKLGPTQQTSAGKELAKEIEQLQWGTPGSNAKNFSSKEINGNQLSLSDYKGQYVLLDFWASWCLPCRKSNPHLKELYAKYKDKGIEFIGIADDDQAEDKWKEAVAKDGIGIWKHICRGMKYENGVFDRSEDINNNFGIHTLPTKILIDKEGMIIGRFSEEETTLDERLKKIFGY